MKINLKTTKFPLAPWQLFEGPFSLKTCYLWQVFPHEYRRAMEEMAAETLQQQTSNGVNGNGLSNGKEYGEDMVNTEDIQVHQSEVS